jgi:hypothetical protein
MEIRRWRRRVRVAAQYDTDVSARPLRWGPLRAADPAERGCNESLTPSAVLSALASSAPAGWRRLPKRRGDGGLDVAEKRRQLDTEAVEGFSGHDGYDVRSAVAAPTA